ncbi:MAG: pilus assembly protein PilM [Desulfuromonadales bacterium]|nr:MAG: pilus assembly protein PilM [Desulfuromonadales bacterium]
MFFSRNAVGMEITQHGAKLVRVGGKKMAPALLGHEFVEFPEGTVRLLHREPNVLEPAVFVSRIKETFLKLLARTSMVSVSLPDACGRVTLLDLETRFKSRDEGRDIIRWKLKKSLPFDVGDIHLDYQVLREKENGEISVLVAIISRQVVTQYEELLLEAGIEANRIDFTTFNLYRFFASRLAMSENSLFVAFHEGVLSILVFNQGILEFYRAKELAEAEPDMNRVFMETNSSLLFYRDKNPGRELKEAFYFASEADSDLLRTVISEASSIEPFKLEAGKFVAGSALPGAGHGLLPSVAAALGAATRNL